MNYEKKYLKYKAKYLELKNQQGGIQFNNNYTQTAINYYNKIYYALNSDERIKYAMQSIQYANMGLYEKKYSEDYDKLSKIIQAANNLIIEEDYNKMKKQIIIFSRINNIDGVKNLYSILINMLKKLSWDEKRKKEEMRFLISFCNK
jgi:hypothetical protein